MHIQNIYKKSDRQKELGLRFSNLPTGRQVRYARPNDCSVGQAHKKN